MVHNIEVMAAALGHGVTEHLWLWEGWAALIAATLYGWRTAAWWTPLVVAMIINPTLYQMAAGLAHGHRPSPYAGAVFTLSQIVLAYAGFSLTRLVRRWR